jgi:hypothetical protein
MSYVLTAEQCPITTKGTEALRPPMALPILNKSAIGLFQSALALPTRYLRPAQTSLIESAWQMPPGRARLAPSCYFVGSPECAATAIRCCCINLCTWACCNVAVRCSQQSSRTL